MASGGVYVFTCSVCAQAKRVTIGLVGRSRAREALQLADKWASTSADNPTTKDICRNCLEKWIAAHGSGFPYMRIVAKGE